VDADVVSVLADEQPVVHREQQGGDAIVLFGEDGERAGAIHVPEFDEMVLRSSGREGAPIGSEDDPRDRPVRTPTA
jgi:hypothetical protein